MISAYGFDPALRHGALLHAQWELVDETYKLIDCSVKFTWYPKDPWSLGQLAAPEEIYELTQMSMVGLEHGPRDPIGIDYSKYIGHFKTRKIQVVTQAFFTGYFARAVQTLGYPVVFIPPRLVKQHFPGKRKEDIHEIFKLNTILGDDLFENYDKVVTGDLWDALILSLITARGVTNVHLPATVSLPGE